MEEERKNEEEEKKDQKEEKEEEEEKKEKKKHANNKTVYPSQTFKSIVAWVIPHHNHHAGFSLPVFSYLKSGPGQAMLSSVDT